MLPNKLSAWKTLFDLVEDVKKLSPKDFFISEDRAKDFSVGACGIYIDFSKQRVTKEVLHQLIGLAEERELPERIKDLLDGKLVNTTENRAALHTILRTPLQKSSAKISEEVHGVLNKLKRIVEKIHSKQWRGVTGKPISDIVNIGVGGSDLGPYMTCEALNDFTAKDASELSFHFVSSMDGTQITSILEKLNPETTLFVVSSKSFTTVDTFYNANTAIAWLKDSFNSKELIMKQHVLGVSANLEKMTEWGVPKENQLQFWDWVGGRFSMWSAIGIPIALKVGFSNFKKLLNGAHAMDVHFSTSSLEQNLPVVMGLIGVWNATFLGVNAHTVLPYDGRLKFFPNYLTQLEMESNGKSVTHSGLPLDFKTCPILWGEIGSNAQHAFYQLLHQGTQDVSCDFIAPVKRYNEIDNLKIDSETASYLKEQHILSLSNCLAQSRALFFGNECLADTYEVPNHKVYRGLQSSTTILLDSLTPETLGALIALYEHKVYVMACIWGLNPFDQWGVELGKVIAEEMLEALSLDSVTDFDPSTNNILEYIKSNRH